MCTILDVIKCHVQIKPITAHSMFWWRISSLQPTAFERHNTHQWYSFTILVLILSYSTNLLITRTVIPSAELAIHIHETLFCMEFCTGSNNFILHMNWSSLFRYLRLHCCGWVYSDTIIHWKSWGNQLPDVTASALYSSDFSIFEVSTKNAKLNPKNKSTPLSNGNQRRGTMIFRCSKLLKNISLENTAQIKE